MTDDQSDVSGLARQRIRLSAAYEVHDGARCFGATENATRDAGRFAGSQKDAEATGDPVVRMG